MLNRNNIASKLFYENIACLRAPLIFFQDKVDFLTFSFGWYGPLSPPSAVFVMCVIEMQRLDGSRRSFQREQIKTDNVAERNNSIREKKTVKIKNYVGQMSWKLNINLPNLTFLNLHDTNFNLENLFNLKSVVLKSFSCITFCGATINA